MEAVVDATLARWFTAPFLGEPVVGRVRDRLLANQPHDWAAGWEAIAGFDAAARLDQLRMPVLAIAGEHDAGTAVPAARAIAEAVEGAEFHMLPGAPHMMQIETPDPFFAVIADFLARTGPGRLRLANKGLLLVISDPPAAFEEEFNAWYDTDHIPERLAIPGFETGTRFVSTDRSRAISRCTT